MKAHILRCDICGHDSDAENPVCVRVSGLGSAEKREASGAEFHALLMWGHHEAAPPDIDMCQSCASGMVDLVRANVKRRKASEKAASRVKVPVPSECFLTLMAGGSEHRITGTFTDLNISNPAAGDGTGEP